MEQVPRCEETQRPPRKFSVIGGIWGRAYPVGCGGRCGVRPVCGAGSAGVTRCGRRLGQSPQRLDTRERRPVVLVVAWREAIQARLGFTLPVGWATISATKPPSASTVPSRKKPSPQPPLFLVRDISSRRSRSTKADKPRSTTSGNDSACSRTIGQRVSFTGNRFGRFRSATRNFCERSRR